MSDLCGNLAFASKLHELGSAYRSASMIGIGRTLMIAVSGYGTPRKVQSAMRLSAMWSIAEKLRGDRIPARL
jgi:hypothetical protein